MLLLCLNMRLGPNLSELLNRVRNRLDLKKVHYHKHCRLVQQRVRDPNPRRPTCHKHMNRSRLANRKYR
jgi:hypothetical protein